MTKTERRRLVFAETTFMHPSWSATDVAKACGYSERSAYNQACRLMKHPEVQERLITLHAERTDPESAKRIAKRLAGVLSK